MTEPLTRKRKPQRAEDLKPEWGQLLDDYIAYPPPQECKPLGQEYYRALNEIPASMNDILEVLQSATSGDPSAAIDRLMQMQNSSFQNIDVRLRNSDDELSKICAKYETPKWFSIKGDSGGGTLSLPGF